MYKALFALIFGAALAGCAATPPTSPATTRAQTAPLVAIESPMRMRPLRQAGLTRSNRAMAQDFLDLSFALESGQPLARFTRFETPITVRLTGQTNANMRRDLARLLGRLRSEARLAISQTNGANAAITIEALPKTRLAQISPGAACFVVPQVRGLHEYLAKRGSSAVSWTNIRKRDAATIFIPSDGSPQEIHDCLHEELAQALGPLNDLYRLPDSVFNDDNIHSSLTAFDMLMLRATYADELKSGMSQGDVRARIGSVLARLNPRGQGLSAPAAQRSPASWKTAIRVATSRRNAQTASADRALALARGFGGRDARLGFSHFLKGRALMPTQPARALAQFSAADQVFARHPSMALHRAYTSVYLSAAALRQGRAGDVIARTTAAIPVALADENGALLASLYLLRAEAYDLRGSNAQANADRQNASRWERYGFGSAQRIAANRRQIASMRPN